MSEYKKNNPENIALSHGVVVSMRRRTGVPYGLEKIHALASQGGKDINPGDV